MGITWFDLIVRQAVSSASRDRLSPRQTLFYLQRSIRNLYGEIRTISNSNASWIEFGRPTTNRIASPIAPEKIS